uniref:Erg28 like protein n=1 Tax=Elaeophora elaphi TaxID=1147741 RepID=A0A0R3S6P4_9BILA
MEIQNIIRAWLAFTVLQLIGNLQQCIQPKTFLEVLLRRKTVAVTDVASIAASFFVHYWTILLLRLFVIYYFDCIPLHLFHIICSITSAAFLCFEIFYVELLEKSAALYIQIALSGFTVLIVISSWKYLFAITRKQEKTRKKLTAVHMMERDYMDFKKRK